MTPKIQFLLQASQSLLQAPKSVVAKAMESAVNLVSIVVATIQPKMTYLARQTPSQIPASVAAIQQKIARNQISQHGHIDVFLEPFVIFPKYIKACILA